jgi:hypothetical protein
MKPSLAVPRNVRISRREKRDKKRPWIVFICIFIMVSPRCSLGTSIVVLLHAGKVWIAADSMLTSDTGTQHSYTCKIIDEGRFYWGAAGQLTVDPNTGFAVEKLVDKVKAKKGSLRDVMNAFIVNAKGPITQELLFIKRTYPAGFVELTSHPGFLFSVVFVGVENGQPLVLATDMTVQKVGDKIVKTTV